MTEVHHINAGTLQAGGPESRAVCHCLLLEDPGGLALVDAGIGLRDVRDPIGRIGRGLIDLAGFRFNEDDTAARRVEALGLRVEDVRHVVVTHADPDHIGGLADFPGAAVHLAVEEHEALMAGTNPRYLPLLIGHGPKWRLHGPSARRWFGLEARPVDLGFSSEVLLVPLVGHTLGHCGVAIERGNGRWLLHVGDAYYLRGETERDDHPVSALAAGAAVDDARRLESLGRIRRLVRDHADEVELFGYHDPAELAAVGVARSWPD